MLKVNSKDTRTTPAKYFERTILKHVWATGIENTNEKGPKPVITVKLTLKSPERRQQSRSGVFIVTFEHI